MTLTRPVGWPVARVLQKEEPVEIWGDLRTAGPRLPVQGSNLVGGSWGASFGVSFT